MNVLTCFVINERPVVDGLLFSTDSTVQWRLIAHGLLRFITIIIITRRHRDEYVNGFGDVSREHWLGLRRMKMILESGDSFDLLFQLEAHTDVPTHTSYRFSNNIRGKNKSALYHGFTLSGREYRINLRTYDEDASDAGWLASTHAMFYRPRKYVHPDRYVSVGQTSEPRLHRNTKKMAHTQDHLLSLHVSPSIHNRYLHIYCDFLLRMRAKCMES